MNLSALQSTINKQIQRYQKVRIDKSLLTGAGLISDVDPENPDHDLDWMLQRFLRIKSPLIVRTSDLISGSADQELKFSGKASFLNPDFDQNENADKPVDVCFTLDNNTSNKVHLFITSQPNADWTLQTDFQWLPDYPFAVLPLAESTLFFSSKAKADYSWKGSIFDLAMGLNYAAVSALKDQKTKKVQGPLSFLQFLLKEIPDSIFFSGIVDPQNITSSNENLSSEAIVLSPNVELSAPLSGTLNLPWYDFEIEGPQIGIQTSNDAYGQSFWLTLFFTIQVGDNNLVVETPILENWNQLSFGVVPSDPLSSIRTADIVRLAGGAQFIDSVPDSLHNLFTHAEFLGMNTSFDLAESPTLSSVNLAIGASAPWTITKQFTIKELVLNFFLFNASANGLPHGVSFAAALEFYKKNGSTGIFAGDFTVEMDYESGGNLSIAAKYEEEVAVKDILNGMSPDPDNPILLPNNFPDVTFSDFGVQFSKNEGVWDAFNFYGSARVGFDISLFDKVLESSFTINVNSEGGDKTFLLSGGLAIGNAYFDFTINLSSAKKSMEASWYNQGETLGINDFLSNLGLDEIAVSEKFDLGLRSIYFSYNFSEKTFNLLAESINWGSISLAITTDDSGKKNAIFFFRLKGEIGEKQIGSLPLVGDELAEHLSFENLKFLISSSDFEEVSVPIFELNEEGEPSLEHEDFSSIKKGITFMSDLRLRGYLESLVVPIYTPKPTKKTNREEVLVLGQSGKRQPKEMGGSTRVGKSLGPFSFSEFGISFKNASINFQLNASLNAAGLKIDLEDLGLSFTPNDLTDVSPTLEGLSVQFQGGPVNLAGALLKNEDDNSWDGVFAIALNTLMVSAIGSYAKTDQGFSALSVYGIIDYPLGGPPFFFITGGSVGFGYNTELLAPSIDGVHEFPLVEAALGNPPVNLQDVVDLDEGQNWMGLGIKFTSFKLIDGFALTTLGFGNQTEAHLLGLASAQVPFTGKKPIAYIEMALLASFLPEEGVVKFEGALTNRSYFLSEDSKLTGGFAFYMWYTGDQEGDFVLTAGGYKNHFAIPPHYPNPDRIGLNWQITRRLSMVGENYFALTPSLIMAGGRVSCVWKKGKLKAWFNMGYDFLVAWQPFYYEATVYAEIGVKWRCFKKTVNVKVDLWGPDFAGKIYIKTWFKKFTISFGSKGKQLPKPISWQAFKEACLPVSQNNENEIVSLRVSKGLIKDGVENAEVDWFVTPSKLALEVETLIPIRKAKFGVNPEINSTKELGVGLVQIPSDQFTSECTISIQKDGVDQSSNYVWEEVKSTVPTSMWKCESTIPTNPNIEKLIDDVITGFVIKPIIDASQPDKTPSIPIKYIHADKLDVLGYVDQGPTPYSQRDLDPSVTQIEDTIHNNETRQSMISTLIKGGYAAEHADIPKDNDWIHKAWLTPPTIGKLGVLVQKYD